MSKIVPLEGFGRVEKEYVTIIEDSTLNFDIMAYDTEAKLVAAKPKENTIGVVTTTPISNWIFDTKIPDTTHDYQEGTVCFIYDLYGTVSFDALEGSHSLKIYPVAAKQCIHQEWENVTIKSYQNNTWVDWWNGELYVNGHQYESITGGWWKNPSLYRENYKTQGNLAFSNSIVMSAPNSQTTNATTRKKIDLTNYNELVFDFSGNTVDISEIYIHSLESGRIDNSSLVVAKGTSSPISLTGITGSYYISIIAWNGRYPSFNNIKLVR